MALFKDMLGSGQTLFQNPVALDYDFMPKLIPFRDSEQFRIAGCIKPLFSRRNGRNIIIYGQPGVGKTVACKHVLQELEEQTEEIVPIYINCWQKNTGFKIAIELCEALGYKLTHNKKTDELLDIVVKLLNKNSAVLVFDEIDKAESYDFLYYFLEALYRKCIILITNYKEFAVMLDDRIRSRLLPEMMEFRPYTLPETESILRQRVEAAFYPDVFGKEAFELAVKKAFELQDVRIGLYLLKEAATIAEDKSLRKVELSFVNDAIAKLDEFKVKKPDSLEDETKTILAIVKKNTGKRIGDLFRIYQDEEGSLVYKSFQRKIKSLEEGRFIKVTKTIGGTEGTTSIIDYSEIPKKLTDF